MGSKSAGVQPFYRFALTRIRLIHQKEAGDRPNGIQFGLAVDQMLKLGRYLHVCNDASQGIRREVHHGYNVRWVHFPWGHATLPVQLHGKTPT